MKFYPSNSSASASSSPITFQGATLILPGVTVGNVGQLAIDLLVETAQAPRIGFLLDNTLLPSVGLNAHAHLPGLATGLELFNIGGDGNLFALQQRAPATPGLQKQFAEALASWIQCSGFAAVWVLGGLDATVRRDAQLLGPQLRYWTSDNTLDTTCASSGIEKIESDWFDDKSAEERLLPPWSLLTAFNSAGLAAAALLVFVIEGDNTREGSAVAEAVKKVVPQLGQVLGQEWKQPITWANVFGMRSVML